MAEESKVEPTAPVRRLFDGSYCISVLYRIKVKKADFNVDGFLKATEAPKQPASMFATCAPKDPRAGFHLHVSWRVSKDVDLRVEFVKKPKESAVDEKEPYAENFMPWVAKFFKRKIHRVEVHAEFVYPVAVRQSRLLLPLKAAIGPRDSEAAIDGISFTLSLTPEGVKKIWITQEARYLWVHLIADREINLARFNPKNELAAFARVLDTVLEEKKQ